MGSGDRFGQQAIPAVLASDMTFCPQCVRQPLCSQAGPVLRAHRVGSNTGSSLHSIGLLGTLSPAGSEACAHTRLHRPGHSAVRAPSPPVIIVADPSNHTANASYESPSHQRRRRSRWGTAEQRTQSDQPLLLAGSNTRPLAKEFFGSRAAARRRVNRGCKRAAAPQHCVSGTPCSRSCTGIPPSLRDRLDSIA